MNLRRFLSTFASLLLWLLPLCLPAQLSLLFSSEGTPYRLKIGLGNYVQNTEAASLLVVDKLSTGPHRLRVMAIGKEDTLFFDKQLDLKIAEPQAFYLYRDFEGNYQLHYRGIVDRIPTKAIRIDQQKLLPWPVSDKPKLPLAAMDTKAQPKTASKTEIPPAPKESPKEASPEAPSQKLTAQNRDSSISLPEAEVQSQNFQQALTAMEAQQFEFEKLQTAQEYLRTHNFTAGEVRKMAALLRFDDTRLQLLQLAKKHLSPNDQKSLADVFQFEYSKASYLNSLP